MTPTKKKYEVGAEIEAYCTKCKMNRQHAIETLKSDGNINRVLCRTCEGSHLFRLPKGAGGKRIRSSRAGKRPRKGAVTVSEEDLAKAKPYAQDGVFQVGDIIRHRTFGPGSVLEVKPAGKMEVGFETGSKLLVCGDAATAAPKRRARPAAAKTASGKGGGAS